MKQSSPLPSIAVGSDHKSGAAGGGGGGGGVSEIDARAARDSVSADLAASIRADLKKLSDEFHKDEWKFQRSLF